MQELEFRTKKLDLYIGLLRPKTLFSGLSPIIVATAYAYTQGYHNCLMTFLLIVIAVSAQIASNIANDLIDFRKGADTIERMGPLRPLTHGLLSELEVKVALFLTLLVLLISGVAVIAMSSWYLLFVGIFILVGVFAYSGGPYPLSYRGWGDLAVLVYFGWIPVITSYYLLTGIVFDLQLYMLSTALGLASVNILVVNNYRDVDEDRKVGKRTLIVRLGKDFAPKLYLCCAMMSILLLYPLYSGWGVALVLIYGSSVMSAYKSLQSNTGKNLNKTLGMTARNVFFLSLLVVGLLYLKTL